MDNARLSRLSAQTTILRPQGHVVKLVPYQYAPIKRSRRCLLTTITTLLSFVRASVNESKWQQDNGLDCGVLFA